MAFSVVASHSAAYLQIISESGADLDRSVPFTTGNTNFLVNFSSDSAISSGTDQVNVTIRSTSNPNGFIVTLNESGSATNHYNLTVNTTQPHIIMGNTTDGFISVSTTGANPAGGQSNYTINVSNNPHVNEIINVTYIAAGATSGVSDTIIIEQTGVAYWFNGGTGVAYLNSSYTENEDSSSFLWDMLGIGVNDTGQNKYPAVVENITVLLNTSSSENLTICLNESGVNTGVFNVQTPCLFMSEGNLSYALNWNLTASSELDNALLIVEGDSINLTYQDTNFFGTTIENADLIWVDTKGQIEAGATTELDVNNATGVMDFFTVYDNGTNVDYSAIDNNARYLTITSYDVNWGSLGSVTVGMNETGTNTGIFNLNGTTMFANTTLSSGASYWSGTKLQLAAREGGYVNVTYNDVANFTGQTPVAGAVVSLTVSDKADLTFNYSGSALGTGDSVLIKVNDSDLNTDASIQESATITISSTRCRAAGGGEGVSYVTMYLNESNEGGTATATDSSVFAILNTTLRFGDVNNGTTGYNNISQGCVSDLNETWINVTSGDIIYINFTDTTGTSVTSTLTAWLDQTADFTITTNARVVSTDFNRTDSVFLNFTDSGFNTNNASVQCVPLIVNSTTNPTGIIVALNETGDNTGTFETAVANCTAGGRIETNLTLTTSSSDNNSNLLQVTDGDTVQVVYNDDKGLSGSNPAILSRTFDVQYDASLSFDKSVYRESNLDEIIITIIDLDNRSQVNISEITLNSSTDSAGINITLNRSSSGPTSVFNVSVTDAGVKAKIYVNTSASSGTPGSDYHLDVIPGGWIQARYVDQTNGAIYTAKARIANNTVAITLNSTLFKPSGSEGFLITVNDPGNNTNVSAIDTVEVKVNTTASDTTLTSLVATETGADTGLFTINYTLSTSAAATNVLLVSSSNIMQHIRVYYDPTLNGSSSDDPGIVMEQMVGYFTASAELDGTNYNTSGTVNFTVIDHDANTDNDAVDTLTAYTETDLNSTNVVSITMVETGLNTGVFRNSTMTFGSSSLVNARAGDTIKLWRQDTEKDGSTKSNKTDFAVMNIPVTIAGGGAAGTGWDLISIPLTLADTSVSDALSDVVYETLYEYNPTTDEWTIPTTLSPLKGYAIKVNSTQIAYFTPITSTLDTSRAYAAPTELALSTKWNLIGINNISNGQIRDVFGTSLKSGANPTWSFLYDWGGLAYSIELASATSAKDLAVGTGYFIYVLPDATNRDIPRSGSGR
tara:strand:- start:13602 stop:17330 length:3729 start_codon:yes stop_codon:yes gene_type:complete